MTLFITFGDILKAQPTLVERTILEKSVQGLRMIHLEVPRMVFLATLCTRIYMGTFQEVGCVSLHFVTALCPVFIWLLIGMV